MDAKEFVQSGKHLPPILREWSFQGWLFRWIDLAVEKRKAESDHVSVKLPDCISAHIYVIDYFLWFMGQFGYTLQRSQAKVEFYDLRSVISEFEHQQRELSWQRLEADLGKMKKERIGELEEKAKPLAAISSGVPWDIGGQ